MRVGEFEVAPMSFVFYFHLSMSILACAIYNGIYVSKIRELVILFNNIFSHVKSEIVLGPVQSQRYINIAHC